MNFIRVSAPHDGFKLFFVVFLILNSAKSISVGNGGAMGSSGGASSMTGNITIIKNKE
jgi:hypothetical protein